MPGPDDLNGQSVVQDLVDDPAVTNTNPVGVRLSHHDAAPWWPGLLGEKVDGGPSWPTTRMAKPLSGDWATCSVLPGDRGQALFEQFEEITECRRFGNPTRSEQLPVSIGQGLTGSECLGFGK